MLELNPNNQNEFIWKDQYGNTDIPRRAGFRYSWTYRHYFSTNEYQALSLIEYADESAYDKLEALKSTIELSNSIAPIKSFNIPCNEDKEYMPHQISAIQYITAKRESNNCTLIADDMGVGKTISAIAYMNLTKPSKVLIICPASLIYNWYEELTKWSTEQYRIILFKNDDQLLYLDLENPRKTVVICSYHKATKYKEELSMYSWTLLVCDESHLLKNNEAKRTIAVFGSPKSRVQNPITYQYEDKEEQIGIADSAYKKLFMTGSPMPNRPRELYSLLRYSGVYHGSKTDYDKKYCSAKQSRYGINNSGSSNEAELQLLLRSNLMIRRTKEQVLPNLPDKTRQIIELNGEYTDFLNVEEIAQDINSLNDLEENGIMAILREKYSINFEDIALARANLGKAKIKPAIEYIEEMLEGTSDPLVIFSHHKQVAEHIAERFNVQYMSSDMPAYARQEIVNKFQDGQIPLLVGTIGTMGTGYTLTKSSTCIMVESEWSPLLNMQAEDRLRRIGQKNAVNCYYLTFEDTLDNLLIKYFISKYGSIYKILDKSLDVAVKEIVSNERERATQYAKEMKKLQKEKEKQQKLEEKKRKIEQAKQEKQRKREQEKREKELEKARAIENAAREIASNAIKAAYDNTTDKDTPKEQVKDINTTPDTAVTPEKHNAILEALRFLDNRNLDRASIINGIGFNKYDTTFAESLLKHSKLTNRQCFAAVRMLAKYRYTQLPESLTSIIWNNDTIKS